MQVALGSALAPLVSVPNIARKRPNPGLRASGVVLMLHRPVPIARAQNAIGGDVGFLIPWVTYAGGPTTNIAEDSVIEFPIGITIKGQASMALNTGLLPLPENAPGNVTLTTHRVMIVWSLRHGVGAGIRAAFEVNSSQSGFTAFVNKSWPLKNERGFFQSYFVEADLPV